MLLPVEKNRPLFLFSIKGIIKDSTVFNLFHTDNQF